MVISNIAFSQEVKTYKGKFKSGTAEYEYYEDSNLERVYNGKFEYIRKQKDNDYGINTYYSYSIKGNLDNNIPNGHWSYKSTNPLANQQIFKNYGDSIKKANPKASNEYNNQYIKARLEKPLRGHDEVEGNFVNGKKNGLWIYLDKYDLNTFRFLEKKEINFKNDTVIGKYEGKQKIGDNQREYYFKGEFDNKGRFTGDIKRLYYDSNNKLDTINQTYNVKIYKSIIVSEIGYNNETGKYFSNYKEDINKIKESSQIDDIGNDPFENYAYSGLFNFLECTKIINSYELDDITKNVDKYFYQKIRYLKKQEE